MSSIFLFTKNTYIPYQYHFDNTKINMANQVLNSTSALSLSFAIQWHIGISYCLVISDQWVMEKNILWYLWTSCSLSNFLKKKCSLSNQWFFELQQIFDIQNITVKTSTFVSSNICHMSQFDHSVCMEIIMIGRLQQVKSMYFHFLSLLRH